MFLPITRWVLLEAIRHSLCWRPWLKSIFLSSKYLENQDILKDKVAFLTFRCILNLQMTEMVSIDFEALKFPKGDKFFG